MGDKLTTGSESPLSLSGDAVQIQRPRAPYQALAALVVFALFGVTVISLAAPQTLSFGHNHAINIAITTASVLVSLGAAFFLVTDFLLYGRLSSFYVGYAFLVFGGASIGSGLVPLFLGWDR